MPTLIHECAQGVFFQKRYKSSDDEHGVKDVILEGEEGQTHVREDEVLCQEIQKFKQLQGNKNQMTSAAKSSLSAQL